MNTYPYVAIRNASDWFIYQWYIAIPKNHTNIGLMSIQEGLSKKKIILLQFFFPSLDSALAAN